MAIQDNIEIWKEYYFFDTKYFVSNFGNFKNKNNKLLQQHIDKDGYLRVRLVNKYKDTKDKRLHKLSHRVVYYCFGNNIENFDNLTVNHKDGNKLNNNIYNLELISAKENNYHAYRTGLKNNKGENHGKSIRKNNEIIKIRKLYFNQKYTQEKIAEMFNTTQSRISEIITYKTWKHI